MARGLLNLIPLLGLASCVAEAGSADRPGAYAGISFLLFWVVFVWGLGYFYLWRAGRFVIAVVAPWVLCTAGTFFSSWDPEHEPATFDNIQGNLLLLGIGCLITAIDAWRLAVSSSGEVDASASVAAANGSSGPSA
ncbi:MAG TPA: hypothetical protein VER55_11960 [Ardenticatenaceae bacterium]|nr:hypothetical protein [Ardenticatenaceae bacterium]